MDTETATHIEPNRVSKLLTSFRSKLALLGSIPRWIDVSVVMLQGQKSVRIDKITVLGRFWAEMTLLPTFFSGSSAGEVVEREKLPHTESIGNRFSMFLVVKKHWIEYQVAYDRSQRSEAVSSSEHKR